MALVESLSDEDCQLQSMPDASPAKWHLAHTTWFFETFLLLQSPAFSYRAFHPQFQYLFNSYYNAIGEQFSRPSRGLLSRPSLQEVKQYRRHVDSAMIELINHSQLSQERLFTLQLGLHHEQQHQELLLMDVKHAFSLNPLAPTYSSEPLVKNATPPTSVQWLEFAPELTQIGHSGDGFAFDNECPRHSCYIAPFKLANRPVTNAEYLAFIEDGGYRSPLLWHADGWAHIQAQQLGKPHYWHQQEGQWFEFTLHGRQALDGHLPVCHLSYFEASAYAQWAGSRLPTEFEWEAAAPTEQTSAQFYSPTCVHPQATAGAELVAMHGFCWEWTSSSYAPYPGFKPFAGEAGEYNGKFMLGQYVLRGGSCLTPPGHTRTSYRNFFYPHQYWQMSGLRLAGDLS